MGIRLRSGAEITGGPICRAAAQLPLLLCELDREHEARTRSDAAFAVGLDEEVPAISAELEAAWPNRPNMSARRRVVEPRPAGRDPEEGGGEFPEGSVEERLLDVHLERRAS